MVPHSRDEQNNSTFHRLHPPLAAACETPPVPPPVPREDFGDDDEPDSDEALTLLAEAYGILKDLCERILDVVGRG